MNKLKVPSQSELKTDPNNNHWMAKIVGWGETGLRNVISIIVIILILYGIVFSFTKDFQQTTEVWEIIKPYLLTGLGFLVGSAVKTASK